MNKKIALIILLVACILTSKTGFAEGTQKKYSNVIFFGDSQSDTGNIPETNYLQTDAKKGSPEANVTGLAYVPDSNPVAIKDTEYPVPGTGKNVYRNYPDYAEIERDSSPQPSLINKHNIENIRQARSLGWTQYFIKTMYDNNRINSESLKTWEKIYSDSLNDKNKVANINTSVNYAWISAQSNNDYRYINYFKHYNKNGTINKYGIGEVNPVFKKYISKDDEEKDVFNYQNQLRQASLMGENTETQSNLINSTVAVPGLGKQIQFFLNDIRAKRVCVNNNTLYVIWIGANDIGAALAKHSLRFMQNPFQQDITVKVPANIEAAIKRLIGEESISAKNIIVLSQMNMGNMPAAAPIPYSSNTIDKYISKPFNNAVETMVNNIKENNANKKLQINFINIHDKFNALNNDNGEFHKYSRKQFISDSSKSAKDLLENGNGVESTGWNFWNAEHMAAPGQQVVANEVYNFITNENNPLNKVLNVNI